MLQLRSKEALDHGDRGWLRARHHFIVSVDGNPANRPLGALIVWNDDEIAPGTGFGRHSHADMEIVTYVRQGAVTHEDSTGNVGRTVAGDVQVMSAGTGISHSERNRDEAPLKLFQIWLLPRQRGGTPRWDSRKFPKADRAGRLIELASGDPKNAETLMIRADARVLGATLLAGTTLTHAPSARFRHSYLAPAQGVILVNGQRVAVGEGRLLIGLPFAMSGLGKLAAYGSTTAMIVAAGLPVPPLAFAVAVAVELGGGLLLVAGYQARLVAIVLALFSLATALSFHSNFADQNQMIHFLKNVMMAGGLLQIAAFGAGALSLDDRFSRDRGAAVKAAPAH